MVVYSIKVLCTTIFSIIFHKTNGIFRDGKHKNKVI
nr:MAG TPA: hypothetical protein [Caudoviricetes sp.]